MPDQPLDKVLISGLRATCVVGINDWERLVRQQVEIDIALHADLRQAGQTDRIEHTVNYRTIAKNVTEAAEKSSFGLIEALAEMVAGICLEDRHVQSVEVTIRKPGAVRGADWVGVQVTRHRAAARRRPRFPSPTKGEGQVRGNLNTSPRRGMGPE
jgi:dihydroneopterin aldolase/D-erythro-7,8-dihydroneopterin triphosphate epimerase